MMSSGTGNDGENDYMDFRSNFNLGGRTKAVILGKGPSFEKVGEVGLYDYYRDNYLWVGINQAGAHKRAELAISSHIEPIGEIRPALIERGTPLVTPVYPLYGWDSHHDKRWSEHEETKGLEVYHYVPHWCADREASSKVVQSFGTTAHHIVQMLAEMGVKEFVFFGVDGGRKSYGKKYYADGFQHDSKQYFEQGKIPANFDDFWTFYFQLRRKYDLRLTFM